MNRFQDIFLILKDSSHPPVTPRSLLSSGPGNFPLISLYPYGFAFWGHFTSMKLLGEPSVWIKPYSRELELRATVFLRRGAPAMVFLHLAGCSPSALGLKAALRSLFRWGDTSHLAHQCWSVAIFSASILAIMNNTTMNIHKHIFVWACLQFFFNSQEWNCQVIWQLC